MTFSKTLLEKSFENLDISISLLKKSFENTNLVSLVDIAISTSLIKAFQKHFSLQNFLGLGTSGVFLLWRFVPLRYFVTFSSPKLAHEKHRHNASYMAFQLSMTADAAIRIVLSMQRGTLSPHNPVHPPWSPMDRQTAICKHRITKQNLSLCLP